MKVNEIMSRDVRVASPEDRICDVARTMGEIDAGALPVGENDRLIGMITDRDIAVRAVAQEKGPQTPVREVMSAEVKYCFDDQELDEVCRNMASEQVRRMPVVDRNKRLVGILSLGDISIEGSDRKAGEALEGISRPGGEHSQGVGQSQTRT